MSKILIIEDDQHRIAEFNKHLSQHDYHVAKTAYDAMGKLRDNTIEPFDYVFLDHDLVFDIYKAIYTNCTAIEEFINKFK